MISLQFCAFLIYTSVLYSGVFAYDEFHKACVSTHNQLRKLHGAQALTYSEELGKEAQNWCEDLAIKDQLSHDNKTMEKKGEGENLAATPVTGAKSEGATPDLCTLAVEKWYAEEPNYNYQTGLPKAPGMPIKHFAQVVWNDTFQIGVGTARSTVHGDIICVRYSPRGAEGGPDEFKNNVFPKVSSTSSIKDLKIPGYISSSNDPQGQAGGSSTGSMSCGVGKKSRIVGGQQAKPAEFPWQVAFRWESYYSYTNLFCGGSLINKKWVVSAAHCFQRMRRPPYELKVILGEFDVNNNEGNEVTIGVKQVINHPRYNDRTKDYDIAVVELNSDAPLSDNVKPVCLPTPSSNFPPGKMCTVTGFGLLSEGGQQATKLMKADVPIVDSNRCAQSYGQITKYMLCAGYDQGRIDACQGDSGGPLVCSENGKAYLAGVVSFGIGCARPNYPGVYANVKPLMDWIETTTGGI